VDELSSINHKETLDFKRRGNEKIGGGLGYLKREGSLRGGN